MAFGTVSGTFQANNASIPASFAAALSTGSGVVAVGDLVVAVITEQTGLTVTACADNLGNGYTAQNAGTLTGTTVSGRMFWSRVTVAGTISSITATCTSSTHNAVIVAAIIQGPFVAPPNDANPANLTADLSSPFTCPATGTLAQAQEVVVAWIAQGGNNVLAATSPNVLAIQQASATLVSGIIGTQVVAATTTVSPAFTGTAPTGNVLGTMSFKQDLTVAPPVGGWLTDSAAPRVGKALKIAAVAAILATDPVPPLPVGITSSVAQASSSQVSVNSWSVYDPTTGPVSPPAAAAAAPPVVLNDHASFRTIKRRAFDEGTANPVKSLALSIPFIPHDSSLPRLAKKVATSETSAPIGVVAPVVSNFVAQWVEQPSISRRKQIQPGASSTVEPITQTVSAAITSTMASASSGAIAVNSWSVYDPTTGPVSPPVAVAARTLIDSQSDIRPLTKRIFLPLPTSVVIAIPVDDLWFESLDVPVRIKAKGRLDETVAPIFPPAAAPQIGTTFVGSSSSQIVIHGWSVYDATTGPVSPPPPVAAPPVVLQDPTVFRVLRQKGKLDPTAAPTFPPPPATVITVAHWLGQSEPTRIKLNKSAAASDTIDAIQAPPSAPLSTVDPFVKESDWRKYQRRLKQLEQARLAQEQAEERARDIKRRHLRNLVLGITEDIQEVVTAAEKYPVDIAPVTDKLAAIATAKNNYEIEQLAIQTRELIELFHKYIKDIQDDEEDLMILLQEML